MLLRRVLVAGSLTAALVAATLGPPATVAGAADESIVVDIGTYNFRADRSLQDFRTAVDELKTRVDVAGLQEIADKDKNDHLLADATWGYYRPPQLRQNPVIWDSEVFVLLETPDGNRIAEGREIESKTGGREYKDDSYATVVRLEHLDTGNPVTIINVHLLSGASRVGLPYPGRPQRFGFLADQVQGTVRLIRRERELDAQVFVVGDFNVGFQPDVREQHRKLPYRKYSRQGLRSMWEGAELGVTGTFANAYLDQVWAAVAPLKRQVAHDIKGSDHYPAVATYLLD